MVKKAFYYAVFLVTLAMVPTGCGYSQKSMLSESIRRVHVPPVKNEINLSTEISDKNPFRVYRPGVEVEVANAIINRFIFDGNLRVTDESKADAVLSASLVDYRRDAVRYSEGDDVQEYRLSVVVRAALTDVRSQKVLWQENITGDTTFYLQGSRSVTEDEAVQKALEDLARRVVDKTIEAW